MEYDHIIWYAKNGGFPFGALRESPIGVVTHDVEFYDDTIRMLWQFYIYDKIVDKWWCEVSRHPCAHVHAYVSSSLASLTLSLESRDCPMKASFTRK